MGSNLIGRAFESFKRIGEGLRTVLMHSFREPITKTYPDTVSQIAPHFRGRLALSVNPDTGEHLCISCRQCERVCPDKCIEITAHKSPETNKLELIDFKIDHGLCMFCGLCTEVCPTTCIINTNDFEMADYTRESLVYDLRRLTLTQEESAFYFEAKDMPKPKPKPPKPAPGAAPAAGAAPAGAKAAPVGAKAAPAEGAKPAAAAADAAKPAESAKPAAAPAEAAKPAAAPLEATKPAEDAKPAEAAAKPQDSSTEPAKTVGDTTAKPEEKPTASPEVKEAEKEKAPEQGADADKKEG
ncbi:MAG: NADH-quinone oxidoreductase subunit I [Candidatus Obscuribacterales bacterium]|nr:NADH-quinone oxidoreductase subunit I [Candidatus Obscuribacterales bacterium]